MKFDIRRLKITEKHVDYYIPILLGVTTVFTAVAAFYSSVWGGNSVSLYNKAVSTISDANTTYLEYVNDYNQTELADLKDDLLYLAWKKLPETDSDSAYLFKRLSPGLQKDLNAQLNDGKNTTDQQRQSYEDEEKNKRDKELEDHYKESETQYNDAETQLKKAESANSNGDKFTFLTVVFAIVLFFGGISTTTRLIKLKVGYVVAATIVFLLAVARMAMLPFP